METNKDIKDNVDKLEMLPIDMEQDGVKEEQEEVIADLEKVLYLLKTKQVKNKESLAIIKKPLDDLRSCLKYLPTDSHFNLLPNEITVNILSYLSDSNALTAAGVCLKWKGLLRDRFTEKAILFSVKVSAPEMDVEVSICESVKIVEAKLVTEGLTSVSKFSLVGEISDEDGEILDEECDVNPLSIDELLDLSLRGLGVEDDVTLTVTLDGGHHTKIIKKLLNKFSQEPSEKKLKLLTLNRFEWPDELNLEVVDDLCNVENVYIRSRFHVYPSAHTLVKQLLENILPRPVKMKALKVEQFIDYRALINSDNLKKLFNKMTFLSLLGFFTSRQMEAARSLTGVVVERRGGGAVAFYKR